MCVCAWVLCACVCVRACTAMPLQLYTATSNCFILVATITLIDKQSKLYGSIVFYLRSCVYSLTLQNDQQGDAYFFNLWPMGFHTESISNLISFNSSQILLESTFCKQAVQNLTRRCVSRRLIWSMPIG